MNSVTWGAEKALSTIASAISLRTPLTGMRRSRVVGSTSRATAGSSACTGAPAASTSVRVTAPPGPVPRRTVRSTPSSFASLRTGGLARTVTAPDRAAAVRPTCAADTRAGAGAGGTGATTGAAITASTRARRVAVTDLGP